LDYLIIRKFNMDLFEMSFLTLFQESFRLVEIGFFGSQISLIICTSAEYNDNLSWFKIGSI